jgi:ABC-2 type transport system ATP-binding protein
MSQGPGGHHAPLGLRCTGLSVRYGRVRALDGLRLDVAPGESVGLVGRNGAGKSTLFRSILGMERLDGGEVAAMPSTASRAAFLARVGFVPDRLSAYDWMTCGSALDFTARVQPGFDRAWSDHLVSTLGIDRRARVTELSRGMEARLAVALGVSHRPGLVLLDEPLLGVDAVTHDGVLEALARLRAETGCSMLVASHQLGDLARLTDRVAFIDRGRVTESVATDELAGGSHRLIVRGAAESWRPAFPSILVRRSGDAVTVTVAGGHEGAAASIRAEFPNAEVQVVRLSIIEACADRLRALETPAGGAASAGL